MSSVFNIYFSYVNPLTVLLFVVVVFLTMQAGYTMLAHDFHISINMPHSPQESIVCMLSVMISFRIEFYSYLCNYVVMLFM